MEEKQFLTPKQEEGLVIVSPKKIHELEKSIAKDDWVNDMIINNIYVASLNGGVIGSRSSGIDDGNFGYSSAAGLMNPCHQTIDSTTNNSLLMLNNNIMDEDLIGSMKKEDEKHQFTGVVIENSQGNKDRLNQHFFSGNSITCFNSVPFYNDFSRDISNAKSNSYAFATTTTRIGQDGLVVPYPVTYIRRKNVACVPVSSNMLPRAAVTYSRRKKEVPCIPACSDMLPRAECCSAPIIKDNLLGALGEQPMSIVSWNPIETCSMPVGSDMRSAPVKDNFLGAMDEQPMSIVSLIPPAECNLVPVKDNLLGAVDEQLMSIVSWNPIKTCLPGCFDMLSPAEWRSAPVKDDLLGAADEQLMSIVSWNPITTYAPVRSDMLLRAECRSDPVEENLFLGAVDEQHMSIASQDTITTGGRELVCVPNKECNESSVFKPAGGGRSMAIVEGDETYAVEPMYCPEAVIDYFNIKCRGDQTKLEELKKSGVTIRGLTFKAKQHLMFAGWKLFYIRKQETRKELRFRSPLAPNRCEITLIAACIRYMEDNKLIADGSIYSGKKMKGAPNASRQGYENNVVYNQVQGFTERSNPVEGFVPTEKNSEAGFLSGCQAQGFSWGTRKVHSTTVKNSEGLPNGFRENITSFTTPSTPNNNSLPVEWQALKGYYTEPRDTLDLEELEDEYVRDLRQMVKENRIDREKSKPKPCIDRLGDGQFNIGHRFYTASMPNFYQLAVFSDECK